MKMEDRSVHRMDSVEPKARPELSNETAGGGNQPDSTGYPLSNETPGVPGDSSQNSELDKLRKQVEEMTKEREANKKMKQELRSVHRRLASALGANYMCNSGPCVDLFAFGSTSEISDTFCKIWQEREELIKDLRKKLEESENEISELKQNNAKLVELYREVDSECSRSHQTVSLHENEAQKRQERRRQKFQQITQGSSLNG